MCKVIGGHDYTEEAEIEMGVLEEREGIARDRRGPENGSRYVSNVRFYTTLIALIGSFITIAWPFVSSANETHGKLLLYMEQDALTVDMAITAATAKLENELSASFVPRAEHQAIDSATQRQLDRLEAQAGKILDEIQQLRQELP